MPASMTRAAIVGLALLAAPVAHATPLNGLTLSAEYYYPDASTPYNQAAPNPIGPFVVGADVEGIFDVEGVTNIALDFADNLLTILFTTSDPAPTWTNVSFNGLRIALESLGGFTSFDQTNSTIGPVTTSFDAHTLWIDWGGLSYNSNTTLTFDIGYAAAVPLPAGLPLLVLALGGLAVLGRKRRAA